MQLFHSPLSNKHSLGCTCVLILPLNAWRGTLCQPTSLKWPESLWQFKESLYLNFTTQWQLGQKFCEGGFACVAEQPQTWKRWEIEDPHHDRRANLTSRTIFETSSRLLKNKNDLSVFLWLVAGSRGWGFFRMAADAVMDTERGQHSRYVSSLKCRKLSEYMLCTQSLLGWDQGPSASALHFNKESSFNRHLTWLDSLDNEDRKGYNCETLVKPGTYHMIKVKIIGNKCSKVSVTPPSFFWLLICSFKVQKNHAFFSSIYF